MIAAAEDYAAINAELKKIEAEKPRVCSADQVKVVVDGVETTGLAPDGDEDLEQLTDMYMAMALAAVTAERHA